VLGSPGSGRGTEALHPPQIERYDPPSRGQMPRLGPRALVQSFGEIQRGFPKELAVREGKRSMMCGASYVQACP
jgi:hypothetical protein